MLFELYKSPHIQVKVGSGNNNVVNSSDLQPTTEVSGDKQVVFLMTR